MKRFKLIQSQEGQAIVVIAAVMMGLVALAGLAIDGGNVFLQRRRVQATVDASAMAGTRVLAQLIATCQSESASDDLVNQAVTQFVTSNGFPPSEDITVIAWYVDANMQLLGQVGAGTIPQSSTGVGVQIEGEIPTYFLAVVGVESSTIGARAVAMSGKVVRLGGGVLPIAVPLEVVQALDPGVPFVVAETNQHGGGSFCVDENGNGQSDSSDLCIGDPASHNAHRGWLNLNYIYNLSYLEQDIPFYRTFEQNVSNRGCGNDPGASIDDGLQGWAGDDCPYPFPIFAGTPGATDGDFIHGDPGARQSSLMEVIQTYNNQTVYVPIFDFIYMSDYMAAQFPQPEGIGWPRAGGGGHAFLYHIVGFAIVKIDDPNPHDHDLAGEFQFAMIGEGTIRPGAGFGSGACQEGMMFGVNLWQ